VKKLPIGIQNLRDIIEDGYVYADKTKYVYMLLNDAKYYFLSRPRRFGKSLLLDTIACTFSGDKELFKGLHLYDSDYAFEKHPVLRLDMSNIGNETPEMLKDELLLELKARAKAEELDIDWPTPFAMFKSLIEGLHKKYGRRVVVLIDEYDKPILDRLINIETAEANRDVLRSFYGILKSMDPHLRFTFITGITKFTKTSVFSGLNNLRDITMSREFANICGINTEDLKKYFSDHIEALSAIQEFCRIENIYEEILAWYDGYSWDGTSRVLNPFSLLNFFADKKFSSYWYASGTPKFLIDLIKKKPWGYSGLRNLEIGEWSLDTFDIQRMEAEPLLFQTGYLTVKEIRHEPLPARYLLEIPNFEVRMAFNLHILAEFAECGATRAENSYHRILQSLGSGDLQIMLETMRGLFASIPYQLHIKKEAYYHSIFHAIISLFGFDILGEVSVSGGRIDAAIELGDKAYVMEFKYVDCPQDITQERKQELFDEALKAGMNQINEKGYTKKFEGSGKTVFKAAFVFLGRDDIEMIVS